MKRYAAMAALLAVLTLTGCASIQAQSEVGYAPAYGTEIAIDRNGSPEEQDGPPLMRMELITDMTASVTVLDRSTFTWDGLCVDCISPLESYEQGFIRAVIDTEQLIKAPRLLLPEGAYISDVQCWGMEGADHRTQSVRFGEEGEIFFNDDPVGCVYDVCVRFDGSNSCHYLFAVKAAGEENNAKESGEEQNTSSYDPTAEALTSPPALVIQTATDDMTQTYTLTSGNYTWTVVHGDEASQAIACGASPLQSAANGSAVTIPSAEELVRAPRLMLTENAEISDARVWLSEDEWSEVSFSSDGDIMLADSGNGCVYSVTVSFPQGEAEYVFVVEQLCGYPTVSDMLGGSDEALWMP